MTAIEAKVHLIESVAPDLSLVSATLDKMLASIANDYRNKLLEYRSVLAGLEQRHGMTTAEFRRKFDAGELGDDVEWFDWDGYAALTEEAEKNWRKLSVASHDLVVARLRDVRAALLTVPSIAVLVIIARNIAFP